MGKGFFVNAALVLLIATTSSIALVGIHSAFQGRWTVEAPF